MRVVNDYFTYIHQGYQIRFNIVNALVHCYNLDVRMLDQDELGYRIISGATSYLLEDILL